MLLVGIKLSVGGASDAFRGPLGDRYTGVTVNNYSPKKIAPGVIITREKSTPGVIFSWEKFTPTWKKVLP